MKATTEDWTLAEQRSARWRVAEQRAAVGDMNCQCLLDLRAGIETLEQRATTEESSAPEPSSMSNASAGLQKIQEIQEKMQEEGRTLASLFDKALEPFKAAPAPEPPPPPPADRPLWEVMVQARYSSDGARMGSVRLATAAEIDAVASWLEQRYLDRYPGAAELLRNEARRAREGA